jgi:hypothetical protein
MFFQTDKGYINLGLVQWVQISSNQEFLRCYFSGDDDYVDVSDNGPVAKYLRMVAGWWSKEDQQMTVDSLTNLRLRAEALLRRCDEATDPVPLPTPARRKLERIANDPQLGDATYLTRFDFIWRRDADDAEDNGDHITARTPRLPCVWLGWGGDFPAPCPRKVLRVNCSNNLPVNNRNLKCQIQVLNIKSVNLEILPVAQSEAGTNARNKFLTWSNNAVTKILLISFPKLFPQPTANILQN